MSQLITQSEARALYIAANNRGEGFAVGDDDATVDDAAKLSGDVVCRPSSTSGVWVVMVDGRNDYLVIGGDAAGCAPWGVRITDAELEAYRTA